MRLMVRGGGMAGTSLALSRVVVVGRDVGCDLALPDEQVSRRHAALEPRGDGTVVLTDLGSTNGTFVNGHRLAGPVLLSGGEELRLGDTLCAVEVEPAGLPAGLVEGGSGAVALAAAAAVLAGVGTAVGLVLGGG